MGEKEEDYVWTTELPNAEGWWFNKYYDTDDPRPVYVSKALHFHGQVSPGRYVRLANQWVGRDECGQLQFITFLGKYWSSILIPFPTEVQG